MIIIRKASINDVLTLAQIGRETFLAAFSNDNSPNNMQSYLDQSFSVLQITREIRSGDNQFFLAYYDKQIAGYAKLRINDKVKSEMENAIELERIYVSEKYLGKAVGTALLKTCFEYAIDNRFNWMWLGVWEKNQKAHQFYFKWGFEKFGEHEFLLGDDRQIDWLMKRKLDH